MKSRPLLCSLSLALLAATCGCDAPLWVRHAPKRPGPEASANTSQAWTPERISKDPTGYLAFADKEVVRQIQEREKRIAQIALSRTSVTERADKLRQDIRDASNIEKRLQAAATRADEDETWPITFATRKLDRERALAIIDASKRFIQSRSPLANDYEQALAKIDNAEKGLRSDIAELNQLREKMALDLERVRLNQGIAEVAELRTSVEAISGFARSLADTTDNPLEDLATKTRPLAAEAELESLLSK